MRSLALLFVALFASHQALARPFTSTATFSTDAEVYDEALATELAQATKIAFCPADVIKNWSCGYCKKVFPTTEFIMTAQEKGQGTFGYLSIDHSRQAIRILFKGSTDIQAWITNLNFPKSDWKFGNEGKVGVHSGFKDAGIKLWDQLKSPVAKLVEEYPNYKVEFAGHSLGAAMATLTFLQYVYTGTTATASNSVQLYTYGCPRVGDTKFAQLVARASAEHGGSAVVRVTHHKDPVPHLPPYWFGFKHALVTEHYYPKESDGDHIDCPPDAEKDKRCTDGINFPFGIDGADHTKYLGVDFENFCDKEGEI